MTPAPVVCHLHHARAHAFTSNTIFWFHYARSALHIDSEWCLRSFVSFCFLPSSYNNSNNTKSPRWCLHNKRSLPANVELYVLWRSGARMQFYKHKRNGTKRRVNKLLLSSIHRHRHYQIVVANRMRREDEERESERERIISICHCLDR